MSCGVAVALWRGVRAAGETDGRRGRTINVGPTREIRTLREASAAALDGDEILLDPAEYRGDVAVWTQRGLVIRPASGLATLIAEGASAEGKGSFVFRGGDARVENLVFSGARSEHRNGAGIRLDVGAKLTVKGCRFEDNENGILTSNDPASELHLLDSSFVQNGAGDGQSHNVYVGSIAKLTVSGCYFARARVGHLLKTRARESLVAYSRLSGEDGNSSYELEFPSGGRAVVLGCLVQQGPGSENSTIISYGAEGLNWDQNELLVSFCTIVNDRAAGGTFVRATGAKTRVELLDNLLVGPGSMDLRVERQAIANTEARADDFADLARLDYRLRPSSRHVGAAGMAGTLAAGRLRPQREYVHIARSVALGQYSPITPLSPGAFQRLASGRP